MVALCPCTLGADALRGDRDGAGRAGAAAPDAGGARPALGMVRTGLSRLLLLDHQPRGLAVRRSFPGRGRPADLVWRRRAAAAAGRRSFRPEASVLGADRLRAVVSGDRARRRTRVPGPADIWRAVSHHDSD